MRDTYQKHFLTVLGTNIVVKTIGLIKELLLGWSFGATRILDNFLLVTSIPNIINVTWNTALETVLLPIYQNQKMEDGEAKANEFLRNLITLLILVTGGGYLVLLFVIDYGLQLLYGKMYTHEISLAAKIVTLVILVDCAALAIKVYNYAQKKYFWPTTLPIFQSAGLVLFLLLFWNRLTLISISWIYLLGGSTQIVILLRYRWFWKAGFIANMRALNQVKSLLKNSSLLALAAGISTLNLFVDKAFALRISEGAITIIHYGAFFLTFYQILFIQNINTIFFPQFQEYIIQKKYHKIQSDAEKIIKMIFLLSLFAWIFIINNGYLFLDLILGHGEISSYDIGVIYQCLLAYGLSFLGMALNVILIRILHVYNEYKLIFNISFVNFGLNILLNYLFVLFWGVWGIPLSTSITFIIICFIYLVYLKRMRKIEIVGFKDWWYQHYSIALVIIGMFELFYLLLRPASHMVSLPINIVLALMGISVIFLVLILLRILSVKNFGVRLNF